MFQQFSRLLTSRLPGKGHLSRLPLNDLGHHTDQLGLGVDTMHISYAEALYPQLSAFPQSVGSYHHPSKLRGSGARGGAQRVERILRINLAFVFGGNVTVGSRSL